MTRNENPKPLKRRGAEEAEELVRSGIRRSGDLVIRAVGKACNAREKRISVNVLLRN